MYLMGNLERDKFFWITIVVAIAAVAVGVLVMTTRASLVEEAVSTLTPLQEQQLELFRDRSSVLLTFGTLIVGGAGALLIHFREVQNASVAQQRWALVSLILGGLSIYFGYVAFDASMWMLESSFFNLSTIPVRIPSAAQVYTAIGALLCLVIGFVSRSSES